MRLESLTNYLPQYPVRLHVGCLLDIKTMEL